MRILATLALFVALTDPAAADAPWSEPRPVSSLARGSVVHPRIAFSRDGTGLAVWSWFDAGARSGASFALRRPGATRFGTERIFAGGRGAPSGPAMYGRRRALLAFTRSRETRLEVALLDAGSGRAVRRVIASGRRIVSPVVAANADGDLAVAWFDDRGSSNDRVVVSTRPAGGSFSAPVVLAQEKIRGVSVAVGARGDVLVAWDAFGKVRARLRSPKGRAFHSRDTIRSEDAWSARLRTAILPNGQALVGWSAQFRSEGGDVGPAFHEVAVRLAGARRFSAAQLLETDQQLLPQDAGVELVFDGRDRPLVGWTGHDGANFRVRVSVLDARAVFGAPQTLSPAGDDAVLQALAGGPGGEAVAVWDHGDFPDDNRIFAAFRPAEGGFGPAEAVSAVGVVARPSAALSPLTSLPVVVWEQRGSDRAFRVMAATRG